MPHRDSMREDPGEPARLPPPPPRSLPGVTAPEGGERANSSYADDRRLRPGVWDWEERRLSSCGKRTSSCKLDGNASWSNASSSSAGIGEKSAFSPKWAAGTLDDIGVRRVLLS